VTYTMTQTPTATASSTVTPSPTLTSTSTPTPGLGDVTVSQTEIMISLRDNGNMIDDDVVTLTINGQLILFHYTLTADLFNVIVNLEPGENTVTLIAVSMGSSPPNTVELRVSHVVSGSPIQVSDELETGDQVSFIITAP
jgi:hypothetical protein